MSWELNAEWEKELNSLPNRYDMKRSIHSRCPLYEYRMCMCVFYCILPLYYCHISLLNDPFINFCKVFNTYTHSHSDIILFVDHHRTLRITAIFFLCILTAQQNKWYLNYTYASVFEKNLFVFFFFVFCRL